MQSAIDHYIESTKAILEAKLAKKRSEAAWVANRNRAVTLIGIAVLIVAFAWAYHQFIKPPKEVIRTVTQIQTITLSDGSVVNEDGSITRPNGKVIERVEDLGGKTITKVAPIQLPDGSKVIQDGSIVKPDGRVVASIDELVQKEVITKVITKIEPIVLADGSTVLGNGSIVKPDGYIVTSIEDLIKDIEVAVADKQIAGVQNYSLFVTNDIIANDTKSVRVTTGYRFDLTADSTHPVRQWCYYNPEVNTSRYIAHLEGYEHSPSFNEGLSNYDKQQSKGCKWLTSKVTDHFTVVDESEVDVVLKQKVGVAIARFQELTKAPTAKILVNYGRFDREEDGEQILGSCFFNGTEMQINVDQLNKVSTKYVKAVVFHELAHCLYSIDHVHDVNSIMYESMSPTVLAQTDATWAADILNLK